MPSTRLFAVRRAIVSLPFALAFGLAFALVCPAAFAQTSYPDRPIRLIVPYPPGGTTDVLARSIAQRLTVTIGQTVIVENQPGANGNIGSENVARAAPDGYTLLMGSAGPLTINPSIYPRMSFDSVKDFSPISLVASVPLVLVVNPALPVRSVDELLAHAKKHPGKVTFASAGSGSTQHLAGELLKSMAGIDILHVPYKGAGPAMTDLLAGVVSMMIELSPTAVSYLPDGRLRALAVTTPKRLPVLKDVPTLDESGLPGYEVLTWFGILAPAGTPRPVVARLHGEIAKALSSPQIEKQFAAQGTEASASSPEAFSAQIAREIAKWAKVVKESKAKVD